MTMPNNTGPMTKDNMVELKPCPFCAASMAADDITKPPFPFSAVCPKCEAYGPGADSRAEAIAAWNTRATMHGSDSGALREALEDILEPYSFLTAEALEAGILMEHGPPKPEKGKALLKARNALNLSSETGESA